MSKSNQTYYGVDTNRPRRPGDGSSLSSKVVTDDSPDDLKSMQQVESDAVAFSPRKDPLPIKGGALPAKKKATIMDESETYGDDTDGSMSGCKYPVEAEASETTEKSSPIDDPNAKRVQDEEISSSTKPKEMETDENGFPVGLETMKFADVIIPAEEFPVWKKEGQYDGLLVYHEHDEKEAVVFLEKLKRHRRPDGTPLRICYLQQSSDELGKDENEKLEYYCEKSTYLMMFLTKHFCEDQTWMYFYQHRIVIHSVTDRKKRWCAIPIHTEYWRNPKSYKTPFALQGIRGICLEDSHWEEGAVRMFQERFKLLKDRQHEEDLNFKRWYMQEQGKRLIEWRKKKKQHLERVEAERKKLESQLEAGDCEPMEHDPVYTPHPYAPGVHVQRNVGATAERSPPRVPVQAWGNPTTSAQQFSTQTTAAGTSAAGQQQFQMTPELFKLWMTFQQNPQLMQSLQSGGISGAPGPVFNINADVVNFGDNSKTTIEKSGEDDDDDME